MWVGPRPGNRKNNYFLFLQTKSTIISILQLRNWGTDKYTLLEKWFKWCLFWSSTMIDQGRAGRLVLETICVNHHLIHLRRGNNQCMEVSAWCVDTQMMIMMSPPPSHCLQVTSHLQVSEDAEQEPSIPHFPGRLSTPWTAWQTITGERIKARQRDWQELIFSAEFLK